MVHEAFKSVDAMQASCVFCQRIFRGEFDLSFRVNGGLQVGFEPLNPVTPGHMLIIPTRHVRDATDEPWLTGEVFEAAAQYVAELGKPCNLITSVGAEATQTVWHFHVHVVPRREGDGLYLPWTGQKTKS